MKKIVFAVLMASVATPVMAELPVRITTGVRGNAYYQACKSLEPAMKGYANLDCMDSAGSEMNITRLNKGEADLAFVQGDTVAVAKANGNSGGLTEIATVGKEYIHLVCNADSGIDEASDLETHSPRPKVLIGNAGSGAATTLRNWIIEDPDYSNVEPIYGVPSGANLLKLVNNDYDCTIVVSALGGKTMMGIDAASNDKLVLVDIDDKDMNDSVGLDGTPVYSWEEIDNSYYPNLTGWGDVNSVTVEAVLVGRNEWIDGNTEVFDHLSNVILMNKELLR